MLYGLASELALLELESQWYIYTTHIRSGAVILPPLCGKGSTSTQPMKTFLNLNDYGFGDIKTMSLVFVVATTPVHL